MLAFEHAKLQEESKNAMTRKRKIMQRNSPLPYTKRTISNILTKTFNQFKNESQ